MRPLAVMAALVLLLTPAAPALAGAGLPKLASVKVGSRSAAIHVDSPTAITGTNVLTVEMGGLAPGEQVRLRLLGPRGQAVPVTLREVRILTGAAHGDEGGHGDGAGAKAADSPAAHGQAAPAADGATVVRGTARLTATGTWQAELSVADHHGPVQTGVAPFRVEPGGPNRAYLAFTGVLMAGTFVYGVVRRRLDSAIGR